VLSVRAKICNRHDIYVQVINQDKSLLVKESENSSSMHGDRGN
jgi:hypothetical protein